VDFSKLKLELYDLIGIILPGLLAISEGWIVLRGWHVFAITMNGLSGTALTLLVVLAFGIGNMVQELGDVSLRAIKGERYSKSGRDSFWPTEEAKLIRDAIRKDIGQDIPSVDTAFDYCLTKLKDRFGKRDMFVATSGLCRSLVVLSALGLIPAVRIAFWDTQPMYKATSTLALFLLVLASIAFLACQRMARFGYLSEVTVFRAYLAMVNESGTRP
jgi:hypothetical protein